MSPVDMFVGEGGDSRKNFGDGMNMFQGRLLIHICTNQRRGNEKAPLSPDEESGALLF